MEGLSERIQNSEVEEENLLSVMRRRYDEMSRGQKALIRYISAHTDETAFMTAAQLGAEVGVSESTVVRFAGALGYDGFPAFQKELAHLVRTKLSSIDRMDLAYGNASQSEIINSVLKSDIEKIADTISNVDVKAFESAVETILAARDIYVVGIRSCAPLAGFLSFYLNMMFGHVHLISTNSMTEVFEQMITVNEKDVVIGISFPRYSMRTLKAMEFANDRNAHVISITDSVHSPMNLYSSCNLLARSDNISIVDSLVAPLSLINSLVVALCMKRTDRVIAQLEDLERVWGDYQIYNQDEIDFVDEDSIRNYPKTIYGGK